MYVRYIFEYIYVYLYQHIWCFAIHMYNLSSTLRFVLLECEGEVLIYNILPIFASVSVHHSSKNRGPKTKIVAYNFQEWKPRIKTERRKSQIKTKNKTKNQIQRLKLSQTLKANILSQLSTSILRNVLITLLFQEQDSITEISSFSSNLSSGIIFSIHKLF